MKAFRIYRVFCGLLLLAFFIVAHVEEWNAVQAKHAGFSREVLAATAALNGCLSFVGKAFLSPLGVVTAVIFFVLRHKAKKAELAPS